MNFLFKQADDVANEDTLPEKKAAIISSNIREAYRSQLKGIRNHNVSLKRRRPALSNVSAMFFAFADMFLCTLYGY